MNEPEPALLPVRFIRLFLVTLIAELGRDTLETVLEKADLPADLLDPQMGSKVTHHSAAQIYANIQKAMRIYYGRGARGALTRIGRLMWTRWLETAPISDRAQYQIVRSLPPGMRSKSALELLARFMRENPAGVSVHSLDMDIMLVDHASAAVGQRDRTAICYVTLGLIQENLFWATAHEHDIDEVSCCATGGRACEFRIKLEGKE